MRMSATDGKIENKTISGELCELLTAGRLGLPNHPTYTVASPDEPASNDRLRELQRCHDADHACVAHIMMKNQEHAAAASIDAKDKSDKTKLQSEFMDDVPLGGNVRG